MEIMGVDRPDRTYTDVNTHENERISPENQWLEDVFPIEMVPFLGDMLTFRVNAWRIIPFSKWLITMVSKSPNWGYSPCKWPKWLINRGY